MARAGKRIAELKAKIDRTRQYELTEALGFMLEMKSAKFDETVEVAVRLGVDPKKADQNLRGSVFLPHGTGRETRVLVFAKGEKEKEAQEAGADYVGGDDLAEKIQGGWLEFDSVVATPDMMGTVGKLGRILGPRKLMPNPKTGTVTFEVGPVVEELKAGRIEFRVDREGIIHCPVGKVSFGTDKLSENIIALIDTLVRMKPSTSKGTYLIGVALSSTMGPGIKLSPSDLMDLRPAA